MVLFLACYEPPAYTHPAPAEVTMNDVLSWEGAAAAPGNAGDDELAEGEEGSPGDDPPGDDPPGDDPPGDEEQADANIDDTVADATADFGDQPVRPYTAFTLRTPLAIVDDAGQPLAVIAKPGTEVEVIAEGTLRVKVRCVGCSPVVEGYLQADAVQR